MDKPKKIYLLTEEQIGDVNYLLCIANKELKDNKTSRLVSKAINILANTPYVTPSDDRVNGIVGDLINKSSTGIVTRDGRSARIICRDAKGKRPIVALLDNGSEERVARFTVNGRHDERDNVTSSMDLVLEKGGGS